MFVIPCKYSKKHNYIIELTNQIRQFHPDEEIVVIDSKSEDKSYFKDISIYNVIIEDINNTNYDIGAYWHAFTKYPDRPFYYFMHDSMKVKANLDYMKNNDLTILCYFGRNRPGFIGKADEVNTLTEYKYVYEGCGVFGPIFFVKNHLMKKLFDKKLYLVTPKSKDQTGHMEAVIGNAFEQEGYDLTICSLFGDIISLCDPSGKNGPPPHTTSWQYPVEKFFAALKGRI